MKLACKKCAGYLNCNELPEVDDGVSFVSFECEVCGALHTCTYTLTEIELEDDDED